MQPLMRKITFLFLCITLFVNSYAQQAQETYTLQQLRTRFKHENNTQKVLKDFQNTMLNLREKPQLYEDIPGEVLSWYTLNGQFSWHKTYLRKNDNLTEVETIPNDDILMYDLEYKTNDFIEFQLVRFKDSHAQNWTEVAGY